MVIIFLISQFGKNVKRGKLYYSVLVKHNFSSTQVGHLISAVMYQLSVLVVHLMDNFVNVVVYMVYLLY